jgi:uncharacterized membrane protein HdeD (DUF308 family)
MGINPCKYWWLLSIKAVLILFFGLIILIRTEMSFIFTANSAGGIISLGGMALISGAFLNMKFNFDWTWWLFEGLADMILGVIMMLRLGESFEVFVVLLAIWFLISGILHFITAINIQYYLSKRFILYLSGIVSLLSGGFLIYSTFKDFYRLIYLVGLLATIYGSLVLYISFQLKNMIVEEVDESDNYR